jgi:hypothetical protein
MSCISKKLPLSPRRTDVPGGFKIYDVISISRVQRHSDGNDRRAHQGSRTRPWDPGIAHLKNVQQALGAWKQGYGIRWLDSHEICRSSPRIAAHGFIWLYLAFYLAFILLCTDVPPGGTCNDPSWSYLESRSRRSENQTPFHHNHILISLRRYTIQGRVGKPSDPTDPDRCRYPLSRAKPDDHHPCVMVSDEDKFNISKSLSRCAQNNLTVPAMSPISPQVRWKRIESVNPDNHHPCVMVSDEV